MRLGDLSDVAAMKRLRGSAGWLQQIVSNLLAQRLSCQPAKSGWWFGWSTARRSPNAAATAPTGACTTATIRAAGRTVDCELTTVKEGEHLRRVKVAAGEIWLGDRNYAKAEGLYHVRQADGDFVVRITWNSLSLRTDRSQSFDLAGRLARLDKVDHAEWHAIAHTRDGKTVPIRILARRKSPEAIEREIKRITEKAARRGRTRRSGKPDPRSLIAAQYTIVATCSTSRQTRSSSSAACAGRSRSPSSGSRVCCTSIGPEAKDPDLYGPGYWHMSSPLCSSKTTPTRR